MTYSLESTEAFHVLRHVNTIHVPFYHLPCSAHLWHNSMMHGVLYRRCHDIGVQPDKYRVALRKNILVGLGQRAPQLASSQHDWWRNVQKQLWTDSTKHWRGFEGKWNDCQEARNRGKHIRTLEKLVPTENAEDFGNSDRVKTMYSSLSGSVITVFGITSPFLTGFWQEGDAI